MAIHTTENMVLETVQRGIYVVRFLRPDLRDQLDETGDGSLLFRELREGVLDLLEPGATLVLNLGLVEPFPTAFYTLLLRVREDTLARRARLVLCRLGPQQLECCQLFNARRLFHIVNTERQAVRAAEPPRG
jgi:hypothetical protein